MAKEFSVSVSISVHGFYEYFISETYYLPTEFLPFAAAVNMPVISTVIYELSFSIMNTAFPVFKALLMKTVVALIFISLVSPLINEFNPKKFVKEWPIKVTVMQITLLAQLLQKGHAKYPIVKMNGKNFEGT
jgi:hypothetical protein